jgi:hypothetical protein
VYQVSERNQFEAIIPLSNLQATTSKPQPTPDEQSFIRRVSDLLARPEHTFLVAGWWFRMGAQKLMGFNGCTDLRVDADKGLGSESGPKTKDSTGFYRVTRCVFGEATDPGLEQRVQYYNEIYNYAKEKMKCQTKQCLAS